MSDFTKGAGVSIHVANKRLKGAHRRECTEIINKGNKQYPNFVRVSKEPLRAFAKRCAKGSGPLADAARTWLAAKKTERNIKKPSARIPGLFTLTPSVTSQKRF